MFATGAVQQLPTGALSICPGGPVAGRVSSLEWPGDVSPAEVQLLPLQVNFDHFVTKRTRLPHWGRPYTKEWLVAPWASLRSQGCSRPNSSPVHSC